MYFYHGYALGVASTIPGEEFTEAACGLCIGGGTATAKHSGNLLPGGVFFQSAESNIKGWAAPRKGLPVWITEASVTVQGLNIQDRITAERIEAHIYSEFRAGDYEANTVVSNSKFHNLRISGTLLAIETSNDLSLRYPTFSSMQRAFRHASGRESVLSCLVGRNLTKEEAISHDLTAAYQAYQQQNTLPTLSSAVVCSLVAKISGGGFTTWGPIIAIPDFGNVYLGELIVWPWMRCLNMIRVELTPNQVHSTGGSIAVAATGTNGTNFPPGAWGSGAGGGVGGGGG